MTRTIAFFCSCTLAILLGATSIGAQSAQNQAVGADKCGKVCHKVEFQSWSTSAHAKATPRVECETCHGNGSGFMSLSVMKDPAKAKAAGLIAAPDLKSCNTCHKPGELKADQVSNVHARKSATR